MTLSTACGAGNADTGSTKEDLGSAPQWLELGDGAGIEWEAGFVACGKWEYHAEGGIVTQPELYNFGRMNEQLAADAPLRAKAAELGFTSIASCAGARAVTKARSELRTAARADAVQNGEPPIPTPRPIEAREERRVDKIGSGFAANYAPTVFLGIWTGPGFNSCGMCSGTLISPNEILTAAHCVLAENKRPISVKAWNGTCLHGNCTGGMCANKPANTTGTSYPYPFYSGTNDWVEDIAAISMSYNHPWPSNTSVSWLRIAAEQFTVGEQYWLAGWGINSESGSGAGVLRLSNQDVANQSTFELRMLQHQTVHGEGTICDGDSGGPAISTGYGFEAVVGVASGYIGYNQFCPQLDDNFFHAQPWPKISWLESKIGGCNHYTTNGLQYVKCWYGP